MFKAAKWLGEKKITAVFKFYIENEPHLRLVNPRVFFFPVVAGKRAARPEKVVVLDGRPIFVTETLTQNQKTGEIKKKVYQFVLSATDSAKVCIAGETEINLADYVETSKPFSFSVSVKAPNAEILVHVTIQRVQGEAEKGIHEDGRAAAKKHRRTLWSRFTNTEFEKGKAVADGANDGKTAKEISYVNNQSEMKLPLSETMTAHVESNGNLGKSSISADVSESGSNIPMENGTKNNINLGSSTLFSVLSNCDTPQDPNDWSVISAPYESIDASNNISGKITHSNVSQELDNLVGKYKNDVIDSTSQLKVAELEVGRESIQAKDFSIDLQIMEEKINANRVECEELKASKKIAVDEELVSSKLQFGGKDPCSMLEEAKKELNHEKKLNVDLQLQLKKTHESNSEFDLSAKKFDDILHQKNSEICVSGCKGTSIKPDTMMGMEEKKFEITSQQLDYPKCQQDDEHEKQTQDQIIDLNTYQMEILESKLERQAEAFQADLEIITNAKVKQEKRAIQAEEALKKTRLYNCNAADHLQEELKRLTLQLSSEICISEKLVMQTVKEFNKLQRLKCNLEEMLRKKNEVLESVRHQNKLKCQQLDFKAQEIESLKLEIQEKNYEFEDKKKFEEAKQRASSELIAQLEAEIEKQSRNNDQLEEQKKHNQKLKEEMDQVKASIKDREMLLQDYERERALLEYELTLLNEELNKSQQELIDLRQEKIQNDEEIKNLIGEVAIQRAHCASLKHSMHEGELEKEKLRKQVVRLWAKLLKEAGIIEKKIKDHKENLTNSDEYMKSPARTKKYKSTQAGFQSEYAAYEEERSCGNFLQDRVIEEKTLPKDLNSIDMESIIRDIFGIFTNEKRKTAEALREMTKLKEQNTIIETELKEMQERYSHMSLKFAEVEGERQQLVLKLRSLKKTWKIKF